MLKAAAIFALRASRAACLLARSLVDDDDDADDGSSPPENTLFDVVVSVGVSGLDSPPTPSPDPPAD